MPRFVLLSLALLALAFAPAPLPKRQNRDKDSLAVAHLVGTWRSTGLYYPPDTTKHDAAQGGVGHITITPTQWTFGKGRGITYDLIVHHDKRPVEIDLMHVGRQEPYGRGLIRREGDTIRIVYSWSGSRPTSFDQSGCIVLTMVRESY
jgi:hypothetical protein